MRIAVRNLLLVQQRAARAQRFEDPRVRLAHLHAADHRRVGTKPAIVSDRIVHRQPVAQADLVVLHAVRRGGVDQTGARFQRDVFAENQRDLTRRKGMTGHQAFQPRAFRARQRLRPHAQSLGAALQQPFGEHQGARAAAVGQHIVQLRV